VRCRTLFYERNTCGSVDEEVQFLPEFMFNIAIETENLKKEYPDGTMALKGVSLSIKKGEIFGLLGPNGAGKSTLIHIVCGLTNKTSGSARVFGHDVFTDYIFTRSKIGFVPQELNGEPFLTVEKAVRFQAGFFGKRVTDQEVDETLEKLSLLDKKKTILRNLSGGMKRRLMIAKALIHKPEILFLDEPTAGVDVELRRDIWRFIRSLKNLGTTIVLTTHYLEEAEAMAERVGIISNGNLILVQETGALMKQMGQKKVRFHFEKPFLSVPGILRQFNLQLMMDGRVLETRSLTPKSFNQINLLLDVFRKEKYDLVDIETRERKLEEIFVDLIRDGGSQKNSEKQEK